MRHRKSRHNTGTNSKNITRIITGVVVLIGYLIFMGARHCQTANSKENSYTDETSVGKSDVNKSTSSAEKPKYQNLDVVKHSDGTGFDVTKYTGFQLAFNPENHTPDWVSWELADHETDGVESRKGKAFIPDESVRGCAVDADYRNSGYDRGHLCPAADMKWHPDAMHDCFYLTNIAPQDHSLNTKAWQKLERKSRDWANQFSDIVIVAGPIYDAMSNVRIGETGVRVPSAFFKVILAPNLAEPTAIGFIYPNAPAPGDMFNYAVSVDEVEKITGLDFFSSLPDDIEENVEKSTDFKNWKR